MSKKRIGSVRLVWLEAFLAVVDEGSFSRAAKVVGCNQSCVTRYVDLLEKWLGKLLFVGRLPPKLSPDGESFVATARQAVELLQGSRAKTPSSPPPPPPPTSA